MLTRGDVVDHLQATACAPGPPGAPRVGVEQEWHTFALDEPERHLRPDEVLAAGAVGGPLPHGSRITVEPGGQVEISTPPQSPWWECLTTMQEDGAALRRRLLDAGILTVAAGIDPYRPPSRTLTQPRYDAMQAYFDRQGREGRRMMSSCAAIQVNVDSGDRATLARRWRLAHQTGPALAVAFACSPDPLHRSERLANWGAMDPTRTRPVLATGDPVEDWAAYVLGAEVMLLHAADGSCTPLERPVTFGDWVDRGLDGRRPTLEDLEYHCTTLFPPVRPRGWLEIRWLDALPAGLAELAVAAVAALLVDEEAGEQAEATCAHVSSEVMWDVAAEHGPRHDGLAGAATGLLRIAADALERTGADPAWSTRLVDAAERWPAKGRCPADDLEARLAAAGGPADLADPPEEVTAWFG
ncbi:MAG: glutamate-cysteine ligase family protein [Acidimicrobiia bacterium]